MGITVLLLAPLQKKIDAKINHIKEQSIISLEKKLDRKISYRSISPSFFMFLELRNVVVKNIDGHSNLVSIGKVRIHYNLFKILKGEITQAIEGITLVTSDFSIDSNENSDLISMIKTLFHGNKGERSELPQLTLTGKNISVTIKSGNDLVTLNHLFFTLKNTNTTIQYSLKGQFSGHTGTFSTFKYFNINLVKTNFKVFGTSNTSLSSLNARLLLRNVQSNLFSLKNLSLLIQRDKNSLFVRKIEDSSPLDLEVKYNIIRQVLNISVLSEKFIPSDYISPSNSHNKYYSLLSAAYTTNIQLQYTFTDKLLTYTGSIKTTGKKSPVLGNYTLASRIKGNNKRIKFTYLSLLSSFGTMTYTGDFLFSKWEPDGILQVKNIKVKGYSISTVLHFIRKNEVLEINSTRIAINDLLLSDITGTVKGYKNDIGYSLSFTLPDLLQSQNNFSLDGSFQIKPSPELQMNISTRDVPIAPFLTFIKDLKVPIPKIIKNIYVNSDSYLDTDFNKTSFSIIKMQMYDSENKNNALQFNASGNNDGFQISNLVFLWAGERLTGTVNLIKKGNTFFVKSNSVFNTYPFKFDLTYNQYGIFVNGDYGFSLAYLFSNKGANFMLHCDALPIPLRGKVTEVTVDTSGYYFNEANWKILLNTVLLKNLPFPIPENKLKVSGDITQDRIEFKTLLYEDLLSQLTGTASYTYNLHEKTISGSIQVSNVEKNETYAAQGSYSGNNLDVTSIVTNAPIKRFKSFGLSGLVSGNINIKGPLLNPNILLSLKVDNGLLQSNPFEMNSTIQVKNRDILLKSFKGKYNEAVFTKGKGGLDIQKGNFSFSTLYSGNVGGHKVSSSLSFSGIFSLPAIKQDISLSELFKRPFTSVFTSKNGEVDLKKAKNWKMSLRRDKNNTIMFNGGPGESISGKVFQTGEFNVNMAEGFPISGNLSGKVQNGKIIAVLEKSEIQLSVLNIIKIEGFRFTTGTAYGKVTVKGPVTDPGFFGTLKVIGASGELSYLVDAIQPFNTSIVFNDKDMHIEAADLKSGNATVRTEADFTFTKWIPTVYTIQFISRGTNSIHVIYKVSSIGLGVNGYAHGTFILKGSPANLDLSGDLTVNNCVIALGEKKVTSTGGSGTSTSVNINFTTGRKVEFLWPSSALPILKAYADTNQYLHVLMDGNNDTYSIKGTIQVKYGEVYYFQRNFYLTQGAIIFDENEIEFDPLLDFKAQIREVDSKGEVVNVYMILDKSPLSRFSPRFESDPPLSTVEIMSMLGSNVFAQLGGEKINISSALMLTGDLVSQFSIMRGFEQKVKDIFKLDLFSIRTQMIQNIIVDRFINEPASGNNSSDLFSKYLDNTTLYLGKYFGNTLFLQTMVQFGTDSPFETEQNSSSRPLRVQTRVSLEWKTPLFLLDFSVEPNFLDPVSSINNTSLSLSWGYSY